MPQSRLFVSSVSRRDIARRRPGRSLPVLPVLAALVVVAIVVAAYLAGHGSL